MEVLLGFYDNSLTHIVTHILVVTSLPPPHLLTTNFTFLADFAIAHGNLGSCYYDLGDYGSAIKAFNYAIQLEPNFPDAYNNLGMLCLVVCIVWCEC